MNNKGQTILSEYVIIFFVVIAAVTASTIFVQRGLEARIHDARNFMINAVINACDADCLNATGGNIAYGYEPYYEQTLANVYRNAQEAVGITKSGVNWSIGSIYTKAANDTTQVLSTSNPLPPECAGANPPCYCNGTCP